MKNLDFDFYGRFHFVELFCIDENLEETIHKAFGHRDCGSKFVVLGYNSTYFSNKIQKGRTSYSEEQVFIINFSTELTTVVKFEV
jgi:hypothetical protein